MRAVVVDQGQLTWEGVRHCPEPAAGEALIRLVLAGVCGTDLAIMRGYGDFSGILGHEFIGRVESVPHAPQWEGCRVVGEINLTCDRCAACRRGDKTHCAQRTVLGIRGRDGVFADFFTLPVANLHRVPDDMPDQVALFVEPLAAALEILQQAHIRPTDRVAVVGDGKMGLLVAQVLALTGCELQVIGHHPAKWRILEEKKIPVLLESALREERSCDWVVECSGSPFGFALARRLVRPRGRILLKSAFVVNFSLDLASLVVDEVTLMGSRCGPYAAALRLLEQGLVRVEPLIDAVYSLNDGVQAVTRAGEQGVLKILIHP
ncbi:MAG: alcohol dehydrogenase catalytic domain-containing protein [Magnetococcus sp. YQC-5]